MYVKSERQMLAERIRSSSPAPGGSSSSTTAMPSSVARTAFMRGSFPRRRCAGCRFDVRVLWYGAVLLPGAPAEITPDWISSALGASGARAESVELLAAHSGTTGRAVLEVKWRAGARG